MEHEPKQVSDRTVLQVSVDLVCCGCFWLFLKKFQYMSRLWLKDSPALDAGKARFYLDRLIRTLEKPEYNIE